MSTTVPSPPQTRACCENGRPIMTDPHTGQTICSCQYGTALLNYSRVQGIPEEMYGASAAAAYAAGAQGYVPLATEGSAFCSPLVSYLMLAHAYLIEKCVFSLSLRVFIHDTYNGAFLYIRYFYIMKVVGCFQ